MRRRSLRPRTLGVLAALSAAVGLTGLSPAAADVTAADAESATFTNYYAPAGSGLGRDAAEPSVGVNWATNNVMFLNVLETLKVSFDDATLPATATYEDVSFPLTAITTLDPILFTDPVAGRTFVSQLIPRTTSAPTPTTTARTGCPRRPSRPAPTSTTRPTAVVPP